MASGSGPCPGLPERTRADAWSILACTQTLRQLWLYTPENTRQSVNIIIVNRNKRIIRRIQEILQFDNLFCNITLDRDWDIIKQTASTLAECQFTNIQLENLNTFVEQQRTRDVRLLPYLSQRLIDTKEIAKTKITDINRHDNHSPFLPESRCMLHHSQSTIHGRYTNAYREAATLPAVLSYLSKKQSWPPDTAATIQWTWFKKAAGRNHTSSRVTLTKLIYNQLATQPRKAVTGGDKWINPTCPHCEDTPETFQHLLRCKHPAAQQCRDNILHAITSICHARRAPAIIRTTLHQWVSDWLQFKTPTRQTIDPRLRDLYDAQSAIGWDMILRGFLANEWMHVTLAFHPHRTKPYNHDFLFPKLITELWKHQLDFWKTYHEARQLIALPKDGNSNHQTDLHAQVRYIHTLAESVLQTQRSKLFYDDLETFMTTATTSQLKNYIDVYYPAIRLSIRQAKQRSRQRTNPLSAYGFRTITRTTTALPHTAPRITSPDPHVGITDAVDQSQSDATAHTAQHTPQTTMETNTTAHPRLHQRIITWARHQAQTILTPANEPKTPTPPTIRAPHHKHSRWRSAEIQRQRFLSFFRR